MKYHEMTKNYFFREFECGLTIEQTAQLCFKSVRTIKQWDNGSDIPKECKRLMRMYSKLELSDEKEWEGFRMNNNRLELPTGRLITPQEILIGAALLEIGAECDLCLSSQILKYVRAISKIK